VAAAVGLPLAYMVMRALAATEGNLLDSLLSAQHLMLLINTLKLLAGVLVLTTLLALPTAWLTTRTNLRAGRLWTILLVLPLAIPGYVMAFTLRGLGGYDGMLSGLFGQTLARPRGYFGALLALSLYNFPYLFLNLRAAMLDMDPSLEEAGLSLGDSRGKVFRRVILPQLRPALLAGTLLISLHVVADFGVVSLMGYKTFSYALYSAYDATNIAGASRLGLMLLALAGVFLIAEMYFLRGLRLERAGTGAGRSRSKIKLGRWALPSYGLLGAVFVAGVLLPVITMLFWMSRGSITDQIGEVVDSIGSSLQYSIVPAFCATALAIPIALLRARYPSKPAFILERLPFVGYAVPALAFALSLIVVSKTYGWLYQSFWLLVYALSLHFLAEAVGPVRSSLYLARPGLEDASRSLGRGRWTTFVRITLPVMRNGLIVSMALVFLSCMKELPLTMLLAPLDTFTLAKQVWSYSEDLQFDRAAPHGLAIMLCSCLFIGLLLRRREQ
jgi:iron(III) transport system permease protein